MKTSTTMLITFAATLIFLSLVGHALFLNHWKEESQAMEERIIAAINLETFTFSATDLTPDERLSYIAVLSQHTPRATPTALPAWTPEGE